MYPQILIVCTRVHVHVHTPISHDIETLANTEWVLSCAPSTTLDLLRHGLHQTKGVQQDVSIRAM